MLIEITVRRMKANQFMTKFTPEICNILCNKMLEQLAQRDIHNPFTQLGHFPTILTIILQPPPFELVVTTASRAII